MITIAVVFAIAAVGGAVMAAMRLQGRELPPLWLALVHGVVAAAGLVLFVQRAMTWNVVPKVFMVSLIGFVIAALGGFTLLLFFHLKKKPLPIPIMLIHATVAVVSFAVLLIGIFTL
jgi:hypothetical protein